MKTLMVLALTAFLAGAGWADENDEKDEEVVKKEVVAEQTEATEDKKLTLAEKRALEEQQVAAILEEHNEAVDDDLDEVVCEKRRVTGSRRSVRVCKTRREFQEEKAASERLMRTRGRRGASPTLPAGQGAN